MAATVLCRQDPRFVGLAEPDLAGQRCYSHDGIHGIRLKPQSRRDDEIKMQNAVLHHPSRLLYT
jgi:hypothetical protein